jgi:poly(3-hydroxybutyrate) depolymerase
VGRDVVPLPSAGCTAAPAASGLDAATATGGAASRSVSTLEGDRGYRLWTPPPVPTGPAGDGPADGTAATPTPRPLVIAVPGFGRTADAFAGESGLEASLGAGSLVATLDPAAPALEVNVAQDTTRPDDLLYALTVYDDVASSYCVDLNRTAVVGHGPGGQLAGALACTRPEYFAAVVAVHGAFLPDPCLLDPPVSFLGIWTADDAVLPVSGGEGVDLPTVAPADPPPARVPAPPADEVLQGWAGLIGATGEERLSEQDGSVVTTLRAPGGATAQSVIRPTGGHAWPAGIEARIGPFLTDHARAPG